jgi:CBS domain-containing protein
MNVSDLLRHQKHRPVKTVDASHTLAAAINHFVTGNVRSLVVRDNGDVLGVITVKDVLGRIDRRGAGALQERVGDDMTTGVATVTPETPEEDVEKLFEHKHINHLPVLKENDLVGLVTPADVFAGHLHDVQYINEHLLDYIYHGGYPSLDI